MLMRMLKRRSSIFSLSLMLSLGLSIYLCFFVSKPQGCAFLLAIAVMGAVDSALLILTKLSFTI